MATLEGFVQKIEGNEAYVILKINKEILRRVFDVKKLKEIRADYEGAKIKYQIKKYNGKIRLIMQHINTKIIDEEDIKKDKFYKILSDLAKYGR
jgi:hypothetical protein